MTVLVTGGTGWIGGFVVKELADRGESVVAFDAAGDPARYKDFPKVQVVRGDILDFPGMFETIRNNDVDRIIHLAAIVQADSRKNPRLFQKINCEGLVNVMEAAKLAAVRRLVFASTTVVYGETTCESVDEDYRCNPANTYAASKLMAELFLDQYRRAYGLDYVAVRFGHVFGPGKLKGTPVFKDTFEFPARGEKYVLASGGDHQWNWSYVKDCASAVVAACFVENPEHRVLNVCEGARHSARDIAQLISTEIIPGAQFDIGPGNLEGHAQEALVKVGRAERVLGWKHRSMREAIVDYIATKR